jgi:hypothetical protein
MRLARAKKHRRFTKVLIVGVILLTSLLAMIYWRVARLGAGQMTKQAVYGTEAENSYRDEQS